MTSNSKTLLYIKTREKGVIHSLQLCNIKCFHTHFKFVNRNFVSKTKIKFRVEEQRLLKEKKVFKDSTTSFTIVFKIFQLN